jgi:hypothetical protein
VAQAGAGCWVLGVPGWFVHQRSPCSWTVLSLSVPLQQLQVAATSEAVNHALLGLPLPADGDAVHHANMLRMLGSLQHIRCAC